MPRTITLSVAGNQSDDLVSALQQSDGVLSIQLHRNASVKPEGDILSALVSNESLFSVMRQLEETLEGTPPSLTVSEPDAVYSRSQQDIVQKDRVESIWEETEMVLQQNSQVSFNFILLMVLAGVLAAIGLSTGVLHLVLAGMLIIPGFQPIVNVPLGIVLGNSRLIAFGARSVFIGYGVFIVSAVITFHGLRLAGGTSIAAFTQMPMVQYWSSFNLSAVIVSVAAAAAGIIIVPTHRSVLTAGVMVALALVPGAAIFGIALTSGQWGFAWRGLAQWSMDATSIVITGIIIFWLKKVLVHKRGSWY